MEGYHVYIIHNVARILLHIVYIILHGKLVFNRFFYFFIKKGDFTMKKVLFEGAATAIITPFKNNQVDYDSLGALIDDQIKKKIDGIVICGTTGEASTLTDEEHKECIKFAVEKAEGRIPIIAGTGSNDTDYAISLSKYACEVGADALLLVTPYYNKATQKGLYQSFKAVADAVDKPIILYNVPSRTGCNMAVSTYKELAKHERIVAAKEASGNLSFIAEVAAVHALSLADFQHFIISSLRSALYYILPTVEAPR